MVAVTRWTGREARILREVALRMSIYQFAAHTNLSTSTIRDMENKGESARLRTSTQKILDHTLDTADEHAQQRFTAALTGTDPGPHPTPANTTSATTEIPPAASTPLSTLTTAASAASGLEFPADWHHAIGAAAGLWRADVERCSAVRYVAFVSTAFVTPALRAMAPAEERPVGEGRREVGEPDVETIRRVTAMLRGLDNQYGGGQIREVAVRFLDAEVAPLLNGRFSERVGRLLVCAVAELTQLAGWAAYDSGLHGLGQRYLLQALRMAIAAADRPFTAEVLAAMSHQCTYLGAPAQAVDLARAAGKIADDVDIPVLAAEAAVLEARGHAAVRDERACTMALTRAEKMLDRADRSRYPAWIYYFDEAYMSAKFGHCFAALGRGDLAERYARRSLEMDGRYVRGRQFNLTLHATTLLARDKPLVDHAAAVGVEAVQAAQGLRSARSRDYVARLADRLAPYHGVPEVDEFHEQARTVLRR